MLGYRAYIIGRDGHVRDRVDVFAYNEDEAKERAKRLVDGHDVELWDGARKIATFQHSEKK